MHSNTARGKGCIFVKYGGSEEEEDEETAVGLFLLCRFFGIDLEDESVA